MKPKQAQAIAITRLETVAFSYICRVAAGDLGAMRDARLHLPELAKLWAIPMPKTIRNCGHVSNYGSALIQAWHALVLAPSQQRLNRLLSVMAVADKRILAASDSLAPRLLSKTVAPPEPPQFQPKSLPASAIENRSIPSVESVNSARERAIRADYHLTRKVERIEKFLDNPKRDKYEAFCARDSLAETKIRRHAVRQVAREFAHNF